MNALNAPITTNIALLILGYLNKDSKLYFSKVGDKGLGWFPLTPLKVFVWVCWHMHVGRLWVFLNYIYILYKLKKKKKLVIKPKRGKAKQAYTKRKANVLA